MQRGVRHRAQGRSTWNALRVHLREFPYVNPTLVRAGRMLSRRLSRTLTTPARGSFRDSQPVTITLGSSLIRWAFAAHGFDVG